jgi:D-alanyl-D-alanine carboxypeptidase
VKKKRTIRTLRIIMPIVAIISTVIIAPLDLVWPMLTPLPDTVQQQVNDAVDRGLDGIIVYVDQPGKAPAFYAAGWKNKETQVPADPLALFKIGKNRVCRSDHAANDGAASQRHPQFH